MPRKRSREQWQTDKIVIENILLYLKKCKQRTTRVLWSSPMILNKVADGRRKLEDNLGQLLEPSENKLVK